MQSCNYDDKGEFVRIQAMSNQDDYHNIIVTARRERNSSKVKKNRQEERLELDRKMRLKSQTAAEAQSRNRKMKN